MGDVRARVKTGQRVLVPACKLGWLVGKVARAGQRMPWPHLAPSLCCLLCFWFSKLSRGERAGHGTKPGRQCRHQTEMAGRFKGSLERSNLDFYLLFVLLKCSFNVKAFLLNEGEREPRDK